MKLTSIGNRIIAAAVALLSATMPTIVAASEPTVFVDSKKRKITYESFGTYYIDEKEYRSTEVTFISHDKDRMLIFPEPIVLSGKFYTKVPTLNIGWLFYELEDPVPEDAKLPGFGCGMFKYLDAEVPFTAYVLYPVKFSEAEMISKFRFAPASQDMKESPYFVYAYQGNSIVLKY